MERRLFNGLRRMTPIRRCLQTETETGEAYRRYMKPKARRPIVANQRKRNEELDEKAKSLGLEWRIVVSTVLHRYPTISSDPEPWEQEYFELEDKLDKLKLEHMMNRIGGTPAQIMSDQFMSPEEVIASLPFEPASRTTEADIADDRRSMERKLADSTFLIVKRNRSDNSWQFPQGKLLDSESTLRQGAERVVDRAIGNTNRWFISNSPMGHYCYEYPPAIQQQRKQFGAKVFYYRAQYLEGTVKLETRLYKDYAWISRSEVGEYFDKETSTLVATMLPD